MTVEGPTIGVTGTAESVWARWLSSRQWPPLDVDVACARVVVAAAHPDDEVLGAAGLMCALHALRRPLVMVWATDGEASHPGSAVLSPDQLRVMRRDESRRALARLGVVASDEHFLALPDGGVAAHAGALHDALSRVVRPDDLVIAPWSHDGHPDHEAVGAAASVLGARTWQYPIWTWEWAEPDDPRVPWSDLNRVPVPDLAAKRSAIAEFTTQVEPLGPDPADAAILPPDVLAYFTRADEWVFL